MNKQPDNAPYAEVVSLDAIHIILDTIARRLEIVNVLKDLARSQAEVMEEIINTVGARERLLIHEFSDQVTKLTKELERTKKKNLALKNKVDELSRLI